MYDSVQSLTVRVVQELLHPILGGVSCRFFARYAIISGFVRMNLQIPSPLEDFTLENVKVLIVQNVHLQNMENPDETEDAPPHSVVLWELPREEEKGGPHRGMRRSRGESLSITQVCRIPNEVVIRQTTSEHSETGIRCSHRISLIIHYRPTADAEMKELAIRFPVTISSCDSSIWNLQV